MFAVMTPRALAVELHQFHCDHDVAAPFDTGDDLAGQPAGDRVGFAEDQRAFVCHSRVEIRAAGNAGLQRESGGMARFARISRVEVTGSTNEDVSAILGSEEARGLVRVAAFQQHGSGRRGRSWVAPPGSALLCTLALPDAIPARDLWAVPFWSALAVRSALDAIGVPSQLQWPNDVLAHGKKLAGILCISRVIGEYAWAGCGIGINVLRPADAHAYGELEAPPAFVSDDATASVDDVLERLLESADALYAMLEQPSHIAKEWQRAAGVPGARYRILLDGEADAFDATALRLTNDGSLLVDRAGEELAVNLADARVLR